MSIYLRPIRNDHTVWSSIAILSRWDFFPSSDFGIWESEHHGHYKIFLNIRRLWIHSGTTDFGHVSYQPFLFSVAPILTHTHVYGYSRGFTIVIVPVPQNPRGQQLSNKSNKWKKLVSSQDESTLVCSLYGGWWPSAIINASKWYYSN